MINKFESDKMNIGAQGYYLDKDEDTVYYWGNKCSALFKMDLDTKINSLVCFFDDVNHSFCGSHGRIVKIGGKLLITPLLSNEVLIYDICNQTKSTYSIQQELRAQAYLEGVSIKEDCVTIFPQKTSDKVLDYNINTNIISINIGLTRLINSFVEGDYYIAFESPKLYLLCGTSLIIYDCVTEEIKSEKIYIEENVCKISVIEGDIWFFLSKSFDVYRKNENGIQKYVSQDNNWINDIKINPYSEIIRYQNEFLISNYYCGNVCKISFDESGKKIVPLFATPYIGRGFGGAIRGMFEYKNRIWFLPTMSLYGYIYNDNFIEEKFSLNICNSDSFFMGELFKKEIATGIINEKKGYLNRYIEYEGV